MNTYTMVTELILEKLSSGVIPWRKTWASGIPCSYGSGKEYRGINIILLGLLDFPSKYWVTYKEALRLKGFVKKGSKGSPIVYWHWRTSEEKEALISKGKTESPAPCYPFNFTVFNLEQTEGLKIPDDDLNSERKERIEDAEKLVAAFSGRPKIAHGLQMSPCYSPSRDEVLMPHLSQFKSANHYYSTLFHELIHSTGHKSRLNREKEGGGKDVLAYSFEELVAEIGAAFLCALTGVQNERVIEDQSAYIHHWQKFLKGDSFAFMRACSEAQKAVDFIRGVEFKELKEAA